MPSGRQNGHKDDHENDHKGSRKHDHKGGLKNVYKNVTEEVHEGKHESGPFKEVYTCRNEPEAEGMYCIPPPASQAIKIPHQ
ncbi:hypothetical protein DL769_005792 [Monosporascus sp. CRB-8-3]|nr:hypothetical protein DL769_005792 [Monosporascus sp. CRB-8-3]